MFLLSFCTFCSVSIFLISFFLFVLRGFTVCLFLGDMLVYLLFPFNWGPRIQATNNKSHITKRSHTNASNICSDSQSYPPKNRWIQIKWLKTKNKANKIDENTTLTLWSS